MNTNITISDFISSNPHKPEYEGNRKDSQNILEKIRLGKKPIEVHLSFQTDLERNGPTARPQPDKDALARNGILDLMNRGFLSSHADMTPYFEKVSLHSNGNNSRNNAQKSRHFLSNLDLSAPYDESTEIKEIVVPRTPANSPSSSTASLDQTPLAPPQGKTVFVLFGILQRTMRSFQIFVEQTKLWETHLEYYFVEIELACRQYKIPLVEIDLECLLEAVKLNHKPFSGLQLLAQYTRNKENVLAFCSRRSKYFNEGNQGYARTLSATKIQSVWRMFTQRRATKLLFRQILAGRCIWFHWKAKQRKKQFMHFTDAAYENALPTYRQLAATFRQEWSNVIGKEHVVVHLPGLNLPHAFRSFFFDNTATYTEFNRWQISQTGRMLADFTASSSEQVSMHIILVLPTLNSSLLHYYDLMLAQSPVKKYTVDYIVPETGDCFKNREHVPLAQQLLCSPKSLLRLKKLISQKQEMFAATKLSKSGEAVKGDEQPPPPSSFAFLVPGVTGKEEVRLAAYLKIPSLGPSYDFITTYGTWGSVKSVIQTAGLVPGLPFKSNITSEKSLLDAIFELAAEYPQFSEWEIVPDEVNALANTRRMARFSTQLALELKDAQEQNPHNDNAHNNNAHEVFKQLLVFVPQHKIKSLFQLLNILFRTGAGCIVQPALIPSKPLDLYKARGIVSVLCIIEPDSHLRVLGTMESLEYAQESLKEPQCSKSWAHMFPQQQFNSQDLHKLALNFCDTLAISTGFSGFIELQCCSTFGTSRTSEAAIFGYMPWYTENLSRLQFFLSQTKSRYSKSSGEYLRNAEITSTPKFHYLQQARYLNMEAALQRFKEQDDAFTSQLEKNRIGILVDGLHHRHMQLLGVSSFLALAHKMKITWDPATRTGTMVTPLPRYLSEQTTADDADWDLKKSDNWTVRKREDGYHTSSRTAHLKSETDQPTFCFLAMESDMKTVVSRLLQNLTLLSKMVDSKQLKGESIFDEAVASLLGLLVRSELTVQVAASNQSTEDISNSKSDMDLQADADSSAQTSVDNVAAKQDQSKSIFLTETRVLKRPLSPKKTLPAISGAPDAQSLRKTVIPELLESLSAATTRSIHSYFERLVVKYLYSNYNN